MYHLGFKHLPNPCGLYHLCPNDPANVPIPESRAPTPAPVTIPSSNAIFTASELEMMDEDEEL